MLRVLRGGDEIRLTPKEFELLALLARNPDRVLTHRAILKAIWGPNAVERARASLGRWWRSCAGRSSRDPSKPRSICSASPGFGYRFAPDAAWASFSRNFSGGSRPPLQATPSYAGLVISAARLGIVAVMAALLWIVTTGPPVLAFGLAPPPPSCGADGSRGSRS